MNPPATSRLQVWIAEGETGNAVFLRQVMAQAGIADVHHFPDGHTLLAAFGQLPKPDVLLLDIDLPGVPGYEVLRRMTRLSELKVFLFTGELREFDRLRSRGPDVHGLFPKPISLGHVAEILGHFPRPKST